jgi:GntR family transcriptional regulator / MocR family aminotransferase
MRTAIAVDPDSVVPLQKQIYEEWRRGILGGRFRGADRVPSTRDLARTLGVARSTVTAAYDQLIAEGYLEAAHGSGTFVCRELPDDLLRARRLRTSRPALPGPAHAVPSQLLEFSQCRPDLNEFPFPLWRRLLNRHLRGKRPELFDYAPSPAGYAPLREEVAAYASRSRAVRCTAEQVLIVNGSQQALYLCSLVLLDAGDSVAIENPCYQGARQVLEARGANLEPVRLDAAGIAVHEIPAGVHAVYVTPSHQFPSGVSMTVARRLELIEWARRSGAVIIEDDYDSEYRYSGPPLPAMQGLAENTPVVYIGTFSKVMFPGLRIGYLIVPKKLAPAFARAKFLVDRQTPVLEQAALADFLREGHLERHIRRMRRLYGKRRQTLKDALARHFGDGAECLGDQAGMHVLTRFDDSGVAARAAANGVRLNGSGLYYLGKAPPNEFVLGFSVLSERLIREGVRRLAK